MIDSKEEREYALDFVANEVRRKSQLRDAMMEDVSSISSESSYQIGKHWMIDTSCPDYMDWEPVFEEKGYAYPEYWQVGNGGNQYYVPLDKIPAFVEPFVVDKLKKFNIPVKSAGYDNAWSIDYDPGGYHSHHIHYVEGEWGLRGVASPGGCSFSVVFFFDEPEELPEPEIRKFPLKRHGPGYLYALPVDENGDMCYYGFQPKPSRAVFLSDQIWHGTYPTIKNKRRSVVIEYRCEPK